MISQNEMITLLTARKRICIIMRACCETWLGYQTIAMAEVNEQMYKLGPKNSIANIAFE
jgi:hypothetical protein